MIVSTHGILANSVPSSTLNNNLFAFYNADNNTNDSLGLYNASPVGGLTYGTGKINQSFQFNGSNSVVELPTNSANFTGDFTFSFFVKFSSVSGTQAVFANEKFAGGEGDRGYIISLVSSKIGLSIYGGSFIRRCEATTTMVANTWYHFAVVKLSNQMKIYCNGNLENTVSYTGTVIYSTGSTYPAWGALYKQNLSNSLQFLSNGSLLDACGIWNRELTSTEITQLYNSGNGKQYPF